MCQGRSGLLRKNPPRSSFIVVGLDVQEFAPEFEGLSGMKIFLKEVLDSFARIHKGPPVHRGVAQPGRAPRLGRGCRQFESGRPDHFISTKCVILCAPPRSHVFEDLMGEVRGRADPPWSAEPTIGRALSPRAQAKETRTCSSKKAGTSPLVSTVCLTFTGSPGGRTLPDKVLSPSPRKPRPADLSPTAWQRKNFD